MARLVTRTGTVLRVDRVTTAWRGAHGDRATTLDLGGTAVHYGGSPSVGVGDVVTVVGRRTGSGIRAAALRNDSTDVSYAPTSWPWLLVAAALLGLGAPILGFPVAFVLVPLGGGALAAALRNARARWLLDAQPSRHGSTLRAPRRPTGPAPQS
jgi:hypothetical protein